MAELLPRIQSPRDLQDLSAKELEQVGSEIREALCRLAGTRTAHFASNLGVVELTLALHTTFDFRHDRLIWDTGHQIYPHKLVTGRYEQFDTIRSRGGLMGYPNPAESIYDLFLTGHAGCSVSTALGLKCGDELIDPNDDRHVVAVIGDGALVSGMVFEAMNNAGGLKKNLTVVLNDNKMSICPRVGGLADYLDRLRMTQFYTGLKAEVQRILNRVPVLGDPVERILSQLKDAVKAGLSGGMLFEELGFRYLGPVDGHNIRHLQKYLRMTKQFDAPVLLHVVTEKGHGFKPAVEDPTSFHAPAPFDRRDEHVVAFKKGSSKPYTRVARAAGQAGGGDHGRYVPRQHAGADPRRVPRPVLRRGHLRVARGGLCRRPGQDRFAPGGRHLQHLPPAGLRPDLSGSGPPEPAHHSDAGSGGTYRSGRADASRGFRPGLPAAVSQPGGGRAGRRRRFRGDVPLRR